MILEGITVIQLIWLHKTWIEWKEAPLQNLNKEESSL